jgi:non-specific protein-tyrosine kinase
LEGKSTVVANLAVAMAQTGQQVAVVDAHLRLPTLHKVFGLPNKIGLSSVIEGKATLEEAIQVTKVPGVHVLTSGPLPADPVGLLISPEMSRVVEHLKEHYGKVLVDTPSLLAVTDAAVLMQTLDSVVLVVELGRARQEGLRTVRQQLADLRANPIGVVVNRSKLDSGYRYYQQSPMSPGR